MLNLHQNLPFHRVEKWNGRFFAESSLQENGYIMRLCQGTGRCAEQALPDDHDWLDDDEEPCNIGRLNIKETTSQLPSLILVVTTNGMRKMRIQWCNCEDAPQKHLQLFRRRLFPASFENPKTAFTFDLLDHFYMDAMECKTPALSFHRKLQRLTSPSFPDKVPVSSPPSIIEINSYSPRDATRNSCAYLVNIGIC